MGNPDFYITSLLVAGVVRVICTVWFLVGGVIDTRRLFKDLKARVDNPLDDGRVKGHVSLMDVSALGSDEDESDAGESARSERLKRAQRPGGGGKR
jgi:hypothetical protein